MTAVESLGWTLVHFLWQGAAVAALLAVALRATRDRQAMVRYALAVTALAVLVLLPLATAWHVWRAAPPAQGSAVGAAVLDAVAGERGSATGIRIDAVHGVESKVAAGDENRATGQPSSASTRTTAPVTTVAGADWRRRFEAAFPIVVAVWLLGVVALSIRLLGSWLAMQRLRRRATRPASAACTALVATLAARLRVRRAVQVVESACVEVPAVVGWLRPVLLVPASAVTGLAPRQLEMLLAHELAHVRRHDVLVNWLQIGAETVLFYHPATWWISRRVRVEREHCCDDVAVSLCGDARAYARALVDLEALRGVPAFALAASGGDLGERVRRLVAPPTAAGAPHWIVGGLGLATSAMAAWLMLASPGVVTPIQGAPPDLGMRQSPRAVHPDAAAVLDARWNWAVEQARAGDLERFWVAYAITPTDSTTPVFVGHLGDAGLRGHGMTITGRITHYGRPEHDEHDNEDDEGGWQFPGRRLDVAAPPQAVALLFQLVRRDRKLDVAHAHVASLIYPVELDGEPYFWLGAAGDAESVARVRALEADARDRDARTDWVGALGSHASSDLVLPPLLAIVRDDRDDEVRAQAVEWAARHPRAEALQVLARAARQDRSAGVRREAAESVSEMQVAGAADTTVALARTLRDPDARREAVEGLGARRDAASLAALIELAGDDGDADVRREAVETLGERAEPAARAALRDIARQSHDLDAQREAIETLADLPDGSGVREVRELAENHASADVRRTAVEALGHRLKAGDVAPILRRLAVEDPDPDVRREAVETLGEVLPPADAARWLDKYARDAQDPVLVQEAIETLLELQGGAGVDTAIDLARTHPDRDIRREVLRQLIESDDARVRAFVDRTLGGH